MLILKSIILHLHCIEQLCSPVVAHDVPSANLMYEMMEPESILYGGEGADELFLRYKYYENCIKSSMHNQFVIDLSYLLVRKSMKIMIMRSTFS